MNSAVLLLVFRRPETTRKVFEAIRLARPLRLYVAADGPRAHQPGEKEACEATRRIFQEVDWPCQVKTLFHSVNLGLKVAIPEALSWFFSQESEGIILEDDCLPSQDFFHFTDELLERFRMDDRVMQISGSCLVKANNQASYYFSRYSHIWGWASWARAWKQYDVTISHWPEFKKRAVNTGFWQSHRERRYWERIFDAVYTGKVNTWDYQWLFTIWNSGGLVAYPNFNLVSNIGFGVHSTNTHDIDAKKANRPWEPLGDIVHPFEISRTREADEKTFQQIFYGSFLERWQGRLTKVFRTLGLKP